MSAPCPKEPAHEARSAMWDENLLVQLAESGLRTKSRTIELGEFRSSVSAYFERFHFSLFLKFLVSQR